ncbi:unnamed protein product [Echinostoma caproni]|uniref:Uncharacterized protein n=1 Tax=Echinostoma caproni TaxID=27848 RepID=A0A183A704_9TREM|nr:unnamed protein product [Echinostoma caproni]
MPRAQLKASKRKGLAVLRAPTDPVGRSKLNAPRLTMPIFTVLFGSENDRSPDRTPHTRTDEEESVAAAPLVTDTPGDMLQQLNLPSLPPGRLPQDAEFYCPLHWIYGGADEMCWEMHRAAQRVPHLLMSDALDSGTGTEADQDLWRKEESLLIEELNLIGQQTDEFPKLPDDGGVDFTSARASLIKSLESIALSTRG